MRFHRREGVSTGSAVVFICWYCSGMRASRVVLLTCLCLAAALAIRAGQAAGVHPISGRRFAPVMGLGGAEWLVRSAREMEEAPGRALDLIDVRNRSTGA